MSEQEFYSMTLLIKSISSAHGAKPRFTTMTDATHSDVVCQNVEPVSAPFASRTVAKTLMPTSTLITKVRL